MTLKLIPRANVAKKSASVGVVFVSAYVCQGIAQHFCLLAQPINNFLKVGLHLDAASSALYVSILMFPWVIKPIYGMLSDRCRLAQPGPNRLRFLVWVHMVAGLSYASLALLLYFWWGHGPTQEPSWIVFPTVALVSLAGVGIAFATVVFVAMTVDRSQIGESPRLYFGQQALAYSLANIAAVSAAGALCARLAAPQALACSLTIASTALLLLPLILVRFLDSEGTVQSAAEPEETSLSLGAKLKALAGERSYVLTLLFLTLWNLSPNLGVSLYFYECDKLGFSQAQIGMLAACTSAGMLAGSFGFRYWLAEFFQGRRSTYLLVALSVASTLGYTLLSSPLSGMMIEFFRGFVFMVATLAIYGLAADVSPRGLTATAMAIQIAVLNLAMEGSIALGGFLYGRVFGKELLPLIAVSSLTTLLTLFLIPHLATGGCKQGLKPAG